MDFNNSDIILNAAKDYAEKGYRVLPIPYGKKKTWLKKWQIKATTDAKQLEAWFGDGKQHNIAVVCDGLAVIDIDVRDGKNGEEGFELLTKKLGSLPDCPEAVTSTGGRHLFLRRPSGATFNNLTDGLTVDGVTYDIDVKTESPEGKLGYVMACPSVGENGKQYILKSDLPFRDELPELPPKWVDFLNELKKPTPAPATVSNPPTGYRRIDRAEKIRRCENYVNTKEVLTEGDGGKKLLSVCNAIYWDFDFDRDDPDARAILNGYLSRVRHNDGSPYPWSEGEVRHKIEEVFKKPPKEYPRGWRLNNPEYCNNTNDIYYKSASDLVDRLAAENARTVEGGDGQPTERAPIFPIETFPDFFRKYCEVVAEQVAVDVSLPAYALLTGAAHATAYKATYSFNFYQKENIFFHAFIVAHSGAGKSPVGKYMLFPLNEKTEKINIDNQDKIEKYQEEKLLYDAQPKNKRGQPPKIPALKIAPIMQKPTVEAIELAVSEIWRQTRQDRSTRSGVFLPFDEGAYLLGCLNAYKGNGAKCDMSALIPMLDGAGGGSDRVGVDINGKSRSRYWEDCHIAVYANIQNDILKSFVKNNPFFFQQGFLQRFAFTVPDFVPKKPLAEMPSFDNGLKKDYRDLFNNLYKCSGDMTLSDEAHEAYLAYDRNINSHYNLIGFLGESRSDYENISLSLDRKGMKQVLEMAGLLRILNAVTEAKPGEPIELQKITAQEMEGAIKIMEFRDKSFLRLYRLTEKEQRSRGVSIGDKVIEMVEKSGANGVTVRDLNRKLLQKQDAKTVKEFLTSLMKKNSRLKVKHGPKGGEIYYMTAQEVG